MAGGRGAWRFLFCFLGADYYQERGGRVGNVDYPQIPGN
jgi:hypothetical protein